MTHIGSKQVYDMMILQHPLSTMSTCQKPTPVTLAVKQTYLIALVVESILELTQKTLRSAQMQDAVRSAQ